MNITRRRFLTHTTAALAGTTLLTSLQAAPAATAESKIRIGACVVDLDQARQAGLEGVEVGVGDAAERLSIADPKVRARYKEQMQTTGLPICSLMMGLFNSHPLASDPRAPAWIVQSIDAAHDLGAGLSCWPSSATAICWTRTNESRKPTWTQPWSASRLPHRVRKTPE